MTENKILASVAARLGLEDEPATCKKAGEFLRVLQAKGNVKNINDVAKAVLSLDLASSAMGIGFDKETALKLSGLKKSLYQNNLNMLEKILELGKTLSVSEVCVQLGCTVVKGLAEKLLEAYKAEAIVTDFSHPQYVTASVYTACKLMNYKVEKSQCVTISRLKPSFWKELETEFSKFTTKIGLVPEAGGSGKKKKGNHELHLENYAQKNELVKSPENKVQEKQIEDYEVWRERILKQAREQLAKD